MTLLRSISNYDLLGTSFYKVGDGWHFRDSTGSVNVILVNVCCSTFLRVKLGIYMLEIGLSYLNTRFF
jgi:hypothetical protein